MNRKSDNIDRDNANTMLIPKDLELSKKSKRGLESLAIGFVIGI